MISRREVLRCAPLAAIPLAGCTGHDRTPPPDPPADDTQPPSTEEEPQPPDEPVLDVTDYGAEGDGTADDTDAIQAAFDDAEAGDTIYLPEGTYRVSADDPPQGGDALVLSGEDHPDDLTIRGDGGASTIRMAGGHGANHIVFRVRVERGIEGLAIEHLEIDGNREEQDVSLAREVGICLLIRDAHEAADGNVGVVVHDVSAVNANMNGFDIKTGGVTIDRSTAARNGRHGFGLDSFTDGHVYEPPIRVQRSVAAGNGIENQNGYGIDVSGGKVRVEDFVSVGNYQGTKTTPEVIDAVYRNVRLQRNIEMGYNRPSSPSRTGRRSLILFQDVLAEGNGGAGFRFGRDTNYRIDRIVARENSHRNGQMNIRVRDNARIDAQELWSLNAARGPGIRYGSSERSRCRTYVHYGNPGGGLEIDDGGFDVELHVSDIEELFSYVHSDVPTGTPSNAWELPEKPSGMAIPSQSEIGVQW